MKARAFVLGAWAAFFWWLWLTDEVTRYLGPRTYWVVVFGAISLTVATIAHLPLVRRSGALGRAEVLGAVTLLIPIAVVVMVPRPELGSLAASRKATGAAPARVVYVPESSGEVSFREIDLASRSADYAATLGVSEGIEVELQGFVSGGEEEPIGAFKLARFYVSCCAADAIPYSVLVDPGSSSAGYERDSWLRIDGYLEQRGDVYVVVAERVRRTEEPSDPYLY
ncbi:MAG: TIGR03943 family putative permease subunit [Actinomycetota bacterium]